MLIRMWRQSCIFRFLMSVERSFFISLLSCFFNCITSSIVSSNPALLHKFYFLLKVCIRYLLSESNVSSPFISQSTTAIPFAFHLSLPNYAARLVYGRQVFPFWNLICLIWVFCHILLIILLLWLNSGFNIFNFSAWGLSYVKRNVFNLFWRSYFFNDHIFNFCFTACFFIY